MKEQLDGVEGRTAEDESWSVERESSWESGTRTRWSGEDPRESIWYIQTRNVESTATTEMGDRNRRSGS